MHPTIAEHLGRFQFSAVLNPAARNPECLFFDAQVHAVLRHVNLGVKLPWEAACICLTTVGSDIFQNGGDHLNSHQPWV